jgi:hypothetical protein
MLLKNVRRYFPDEMPLGDDVQYFIDEEGNDWYESLPKFKKRYAIAFDSDGVVRFVTDDVSGIYPAELSVTDIESIPDDYNPNENWLFDGVAITRVAVDYVAQAEVEKSRRLVVATTTMAPLQDAVDLGIATDEEETLLDSWKKYRVMINRVDTSKAPDIEWPDIPE